MTLISFRIFPESFSNPFKQFSFRTIFITEIMPIIFYLYIGRTDTIVLITAQSLSNTF